MLRSLKVGASTMWASARGKNLVGMGRALLAPLRVGLRQAGVPVLLNTALTDLYVAAARAQNEGPIDLNTLAQVGSSAGGARPKALIGIHRSDPQTIIAGAAASATGTVIVVLKNWRREVCELFFCIGFIQTGGKTNICR